MKKYNVHWSVILLDDFVISADSMDDARQIFIDRIMDEISLNDMKFADDYIDVWECEDQDEEQYYILNR